MFRFFAQALQQPQAAWPQKHIRSLKTSQVDRLNESCTYRYSWIHDNSLASPHTFADLRFVTLMPLPRSRWNACCHPASNKPYREPRRPRSRRGTPHQSRIDSLPSTRPDAWYICETAAQNDRLLAFGSCFAGVPPLSGFRFWGGSDCIRGRSASGSTLIVPVSSLDFVASRIGISGPKILPRAGTRSLSRLLVFNLASLGF